MKEISCFDPIECKDARVLILGSMPGVESLAQQQYYAHPRNSFWYIMDSLFGFDMNADYNNRAASLIKNKIALWDVLSQCIRQGSLDTAIEKDSIIRNDFLTFFKQHPEIRYVFFNGQKAEKEFKRFILPELDDNYSYIQYSTLPSTSPAMASLNKDQKLKIWREVKNRLLENNT